MIGPSAADERAISLRRKLKLKGEHLKTRWVSSGPVLWIVFFVLSLNGIGAAGGFFMLFGLKNTLVLGLLAIVLAEVLMLKANFFSTGVESALYGSGILGIIFGLPGEPSDETPLVFAVGAAIAGWRVRNPWFGAASVVLVLVYLGLKFDWIVVALAGLLISLAVLIALGREVQRPSTEWLLIATAFATLAAGGATTLVQARELWWMGLVYAAAAIVIGIRIRHHVPFLCALGGIGISAFDLYERIPLNAESQLTIAGVLFVAVASILTRALRGRTEGFVIAPATFTDYDEMIESGATVALAPQPAPAPEAQPAGGGSFGGAGATGDY